MRATRTNLALVIAGLGALLALSLVLGLKLGAVETPWSVLAGWAGGGPVEPHLAIILGRLRLPRLILAALVGASLSLSGAVFQAVLKNPLAEPFILGVSGGAATGGVLAMLLGLGGLWGVSSLAFAGALLTVGLVLFIARRRGRMETSTLILAGVMVNAFFTAVIMFIISTTTDEKLHHIIFWLYGDLGGATMEKALFLAPAAAFVLVAVFALSRQLNLLAAGDEAASALGVNVEGLKFALFALVSLICAITVSLSGLIGFVGLMVPHLMRMALGHDHRLLIPASALAGAAFLTLADTAARTAISPMTLPVGVVTAALGAPFFILLLARRGSRWW